MSRFARRAVAVSVAALIVLGWAASAFAAVRFAEIRYDPPGKDSAHLNEEWIVIKNTGTSKVDLSGWSITSGSKSYTFKSGVTIGPGKVIYVHTGSGDDGWRHKYWGRSKPAWPNDNGGAVLWSGGLPIKLKDTCTYGSLPGSDGTANC